MRRNILAIGRDGIPDQYSTQLFEKIENEVRKLNIPSDWKFRKCFKPNSSGLNQAGELLFKANSWVMEFYLNDAFYEQFAISNIKELYKIGIANKHLVHRINKR